MPASSSRPRPADAFASVLRREREAAGMTQAELAEQAGLGVRTVSNLERGINTSPYPSTVRLLADALSAPSHVRDELVRAARRRGGSPSAAPRTTGGYLGALPSSRLVARDAERLSIVAAVDAVETGAGKLVLLAGEPGIGKTRLAQEAGAYAAERGFVVASGRCYEPQSQTPFSPWLDVIETLHAAAPESVRRHLAERWPLLITLVPDLFPSSPAPATQGADAAQRLHRAVAGVVREVAEHHPVALLVDDLQWADGASLALLAHVARSTPADRVLIIGTYRDVEVSATHPVRTTAHGLHREGLAETVTLSRFDEDATYQLIVDRLDRGEVSDELTGLIHRHTDGNPFFTVEILNALIERGDLVLDDATWDLRSAARIEAPTTVSEAISERVSRLSADTQMLLDCASVLGEVFDFEELSVAGLDEDVLERALDEAVASGLLLGTVDARLAFDHSLTQQSLYDGLSVARRRRLHRSVGEELERRHPAMRKGRSAEIARHLETGGRPDRAIEFFLLAGDEAAALHTNDDAVRLYQHALTLADDVGSEEAVAAGLERLGQIELITARYDDALQHLTRAADTCRRIDAVETRLRVEGLIAAAQHRRGDGETAAARLSRVVAELDERIGPDGRAPGVAALCTGLARVRITLGQYGPALEAAIRAARLAREASEIAVEADARSVGGTILLFIDRPADAVTELDRAIELAATVDAVTVESEAILALHWALTMQGDLGRAEELGERGLVVTRRAGNPDAEAVHAADLGLTLYYRGRWTEAEKHLERGVDLARSGSPTLFSGIPPAYLGLLRSGQGDIAGAAACYEDAASAPDLQTFAFDGYLDARLAELELSQGRPERAAARLDRWLGRESPTQLHDVMLLSVAAEAHLALGDLAQGEALVSQALRRAAATANEIDGIDAQRLAGRCRVLRGWLVEARTCLEAALGRAAAVSYPAAEARIHDDLARLSEAEGDRDAARDHLDAADRIRALLRTS